MHLLRLCSGSWPLTVRVTNQVIGAMIGWYTELRGLPPGSRPHFGRLRVTPSARCAAPSA